MNILPPVSTSFIQKSQLQFTGVSPKNLAMEAPRTIKTAVDHKRNYQDLLNDVPKGDMEPVLVMPGFLATDKATRPLRQFLKDINYRAYATRAGRNIPFNKNASVKYYVKRVEEIYKKNQQKVALVGWSLGGVQAREVAKLIPDKVSQVITLGSPVNNDVAHFISRDRKRLKTVPDSPPVPLTVIYSDRDGIVSRDDAHQYGETGAHNIHVYVPHLGMPRSIDIMSILANTLAKNTEA